MTEVGIVDLKEWDIVQVIKCLAQLGDLTCNYEAQTIQFK